MGNVGTPGRWLRNIKDGTIYPHTVHLEKNPNVEEVSEEIAFPGKHIPEEQKGRELTLDLSTPEEVVEEATDAPEERSNEELSADASVGLPKALSGTPIVGALAGSS